MLYCNEYAGTLFEGDTLLLISTKDGMDAIFLTLVNDDVDGGSENSCIAQTTTASQLFFALNGTSCLRNEFFLEIFDFKTFFKFCTITMTY